MSTTWATCNLRRVAAVLAILATLAAPAWAGNWTIEPFSPTGDHLSEMTLNVSLDGTLFASCLRSGYTLFAATKQHAAWQTLPVIPGINGYDTAFDANGKLYAATRRYENSQVTLMLSELTASGAWQSSDLVTGNSLTLLSLAFDPQNRPHILYKDQSAKTLKHMVLTDTGWTTRSVVTDANFGYGHGSPEALMALDNRGVENYLWNDSQTILWHTMWNGTSYVQRLVGNGYLGSLVFDSRNVLHATWFNGTRVHYGRFDGATWTTQILNTEWDRGSISLDIFDRPQIACGANHNDLRLASFTGSKWVFDPITTWPGTIMGPEGQALAIDRTNQAHIIYTDDNGNLSYAYKDLGQHLSLRPIFDVRATSSDAQLFTLTESAPSILTQQLASSNIYRRGVMEFDLSTIQPGQAISAAALKLNISGLTSTASVYPRLHVFGYTGDGVAQPADACNVATLIGESDVPRTQPITVVLDAAFVDSLAFKKGHLGLVLFDPDTGKQVTFDTLEAGASAPSLVLEYTYRGDSDGDGRVNVYDLQMLAVAWNSVTGDSRYNAACDFNHDGRINVYDLQLLAMNWNR